MTNKQFSERLNKELDNIGLPMLSAERIDAFSKLMKIAKFKAEALLNGMTVPAEELLENLAMELEVNPEWLIGKSDERVKKKK